MRAVCAVQCRGVCAVDARRLSFEVLLGSERWQGTPFADPRGQSAQKTSPPSECVALGASERPLDAYPNREVNLGALAVARALPIKKLKSFATGTCPGRAIVSKEPDVVSRARAMGMLATPHTFRARAVTGYPNVQAEVVQVIESLRRRRRDHRQSCKVPRR